MERMQSQPLLKESELKPDTKAKETTHNEEDNNRDNSINTANELQASDIKVAGMSTAKESEETKEEEPSKEISTLLKESATKPEINNDEDECDEKYDQNTRVEPGTKLTTKEIVSIMDEIDGRFA